MAHVKEALESFNKSHASAQEHDKKLILRTAKHPMPPSAGGLTELPNQQSSQDASQDA